MASWIEWARGPLFIFALTFLLLGLIRHAVLTLSELVRAMRIAGDKTLPYKQVFIATVKWLLPLGKLKDHVLLGVTSLLFHVAVILVPLFLGGHIALWARGTGLSWPAIPNGLADVLTIIALITAVALIVQRLAASATRSLSRFQDYALPLLIALPFASGFLVVHPNLNPFSYDMMLLTHLLSSNLVLILIPLTKLTHIVLLPSVQLVSEVAWHWPPDAGSKVAVALGKEDQLI